MSEESYLVKIIPPKGYAEYTLEFARRHLAVFAGLVALVLLGGVAIHAYELHAARTQVERLKAVDAAQNQRLSQIDAQAGRLAGELRRLELQNAEIRKAIGIQTPSHRAPTSLHAAAHRGNQFAYVASDLARIAAESERARAEQVTLHGLVLRVLNVRRIEAIAHARMLASIPSLVPAGDGTIASGFGYRYTPWPEFHKGVDLEADYGDTVRAAASGVVAFAGWDDGGFGYRVDIDHGNGLHTWYCHLARFRVHEGQAVGKGEPIATVGSTGEATGPHLHYQVMRDGNPIDPRPFLNGEGAKVLGLDTSGSLRR